MLIDTQSSEQPALLSPDGLSPDGPGSDRPGSEGSGSARPPGSDVVRPRRARAADATLAGAVDLARAAALAAAGDGSVGGHLGVVGEGERVLTHGFSCTAKGYSGWQWSVTLARAPRSRAATVSEVHLLPSTGAVLAPDWVPWAQRLAPGDLSAGDVLPRLPDDPLLDQGYEACGEQDVDALAVWELGLGRPRVLSRQGRAEAAERWYGAENGPRDPFAQQAAAACESCGYFLPMPGGLRQLFGVCANEWSPADGKVVSLDHGCGAHSETDVEPRAERVDTPVLDEFGYVTVDLDRPAPTDAGD